MVSVALAVSILSLLLSVVTVTAAVLYAWKLKQEIDPLLRIAEGTMKQQGYQALGPQYGIPPAPVSEDWKKYMARSLQNAWPGTISDGPTDVRQADANPWDHDEHIEEVEHQPAPGSKAAQAPPG